MTPFSFEWQWNADYFVFMGLLYLALTAIACGLVYCAVKTWLDLESGEKPKSSEKISYRSKYSKF